MPDQPAQFVTIVSGLPRSGTSMMMQMVAAGGIPVLTDGVRVADIDNPKGYFEFEPVKRIKNDTSWLAEAEGKVVKLIYHLLYHLPTTYHYRVLFMRRDLDEVLGSQQEMLRRRRERGATVSQEELKRIFEKELDRVDQWMEHQPCLEVLTIEHRQVLVAPRHQAQRICDFLGGDLDVHAMASVVMPQLYRQQGES